MRVEVPKMKPERKEERTTMTKDQNEVDGHSHPNETKNKKRASTMKNGDRQKNALQMVPRLQAIDLSKAKIEKIKNRKKEGTLKAQIQTVHIRYF